MNYIFGVIFRPVAVPIVNIFNFVSSNLVINLGWISEYVLCQWPGCRCDDITGYLCEFDAHFFVVVVGKMRTSITNDEWPGHPKISNK